LFREYSECLLYPDHQITWKHACIPRAAGSCTFLVF
jgi:hypothetical protein